MRSLEDIRGVRKTFKTIDNILEEMENLIIADIPEQEKEEKSEEIVAKFIVQMIKLNNLSNIM